MSPAHPRGTALPRVATRKAPGRYEGQLVTETEGTWGTGVEASLPANANPDSEAYIEGLSCASAGNCAAVGEYYDGAVEEPETFLLTETEGTWGTAVQAELPANAEPKSNTIHTKGVSCGSVGNCAVVGEYFDTSDNMQGFLLNETEGTWDRAIEARLPANANPNPGPSIEEVQCASAGNCTAVGRYIDSLGNTQGLLLTETSGAWNTGVEAPLPPGAHSGPSLLGGSLACPSAGDCSYVDGYKDSSEHREGLLLTREPGSLGSCPSGDAAVERRDRTGSLTALCVVRFAWQLHCCGRIHRQLRTPAGPASHRRARDSGPLREWPAGWRLRGEPDPDFIDLRGTRWWVRSEWDGHLHRARPAVLAANLVCFGRHGGRYRERLWRWDLSPFYRLHSAQPR